jgi:hypothetical protein
MDLNLKTQNKRIRFPKRFAKNIIISTVMHMKQKIESNTTTNKKVNHFVVFIDESAKVSSEFDNKDVYSTFRRVILGKEVDEIAHTTLVQSSLRTDNFGVTLSNRVVYSVDIAYELNSTEIVHNIWLPILKEKRNINITDKSLIFKLILLEMLLS